MKKITSFLFIIVFICSLCACGSKDTTIKNTVTTTYEDDGYKGEITIQLPVSNNSRKIYEEAIEKYKELRPNVSVIVEYKVNSNFYNTYKSEVSSGVNFADAAFIDHTYVQSLASDGIIIPVTSYVNEVKDLYVDNIIEANALDNEYYAFPFSANTICLFYNKDIVGDRKIPTTYEEFLSVCQSIYDDELLKSDGERNKIFSLYTSNDSKSFGTFIFNSWVKRESGMLLSEDLKTAYINSDQVKEVLTKWKEIADKGFADPNTSYEYDFYYGNVAFIEMGCWKVPQLFLDNPKINFGVAPLFKLEEDGENSSVLGLYSLCVTKQNDENKMKLAADFCKFLSTNIETQLGYAKDTCCLPVTKEACNDEYYSSYEWQVFINAMSTAAIRPGSPIWPSIEPQLTTLIANVLQGRNTIDEGVNYINNKVQSSLTSYYNKKKR